MQTAIIIKQLYSYVKIEKKLTLVEEIMLL